MQKNFESIEDFRLIYSSWGSFSDLLVYHFDCIRRIYPSIDSLIDYFTFMGFMDAFRLIYRLFRSFQTYTNH